MRSCILIPEFIHVHNHTQYSKFDGYSSIPDLVHAAKCHGMSAVGVTDHGTVAGIIQFLKECRKPKSAFGPSKTEEWKKSYDNGIKPILGMEAYQCRDHRAKSKDDIETKDDVGNVICTIKGQPGGRKDNRHVNIIAKDHEGFQNLCTLSQLSSLDGYYYDPRLDFELLEKHKQGLIATSACLSNIVNWNLSIGEYDKAKQAAGAMSEIFGSDYYLEIMWHGLSNEAKIIPDILKISKELNIKIIATNDCHYVKQSDAAYQQVLMCMSSGRSIKDPKRIKFPYDEFYFKSQEEMFKMFGHIPVIMRNTMEIAEKCDYSELIFVEDGGSMKLPEFQIPERYSNPFDYLSDLAWKGMKDQKLDTSEAHVQQLKQELSDIKLIWDTKRYDFTTYFLIVNDIIQFSRKNKIAYGIRGSGYGSVLLRCLNITYGADPIKYGLMWERFLGFDSKFFISEDDFGVTRK